jgi:predicted metal-dependent enzyme (double-stranded beta helix superfamily)
MSDGSHSSDPSSWDPALDAVAAAPENHIVLHEDEFIRVLSVRMAPGETGKVHHHRFPSVVILTNATRTRDFDGVTGEVWQSAGPGHNEQALPFVVVLEPQPVHYVENIDTKASHGIRIEFKGGFPTI